MNPLMARRTRRPVDWVLVAIVGALVTLGLLSLYSASRADDSNHYARQMFWYLLGTGAAAFIASVDYRLISRLAYPLMFGGVVLLVVVLVAGTTINGSRRWLAFGPLSVQPSEFLKLAVVIFTARWFADHECPEGRGLRDLLAPTLVIMVPFVLILNQPDLGTALTLWMIFGTVVLFDRVKPWLTVSGIVGAIAAIPLMWVFVLREYQKDRVRAFLDPQAELQGDAWQVAQSRIAVGSGGWTGKGWLQGTQVQGGFVPYDESDFIFSHTGEQFGFIGAVVVVSLYLALALWALNIARCARDRFGVLLAVGIAGLLFWHVAVNIAMNIGLLPVVGLWLPFFSRGGTAVLLMMFCVGILMSISMRRTMTRDVRWTR